LARARLSRKYFEADSDDKFLIVFDRYPQIMYEPAGKALQETAWNDLMKELSFAKPMEILKGSN
jgi:hypothetical protein